MKRSDYDGGGEPMNGLKPSVRATYDSTTDGDQYHVTVRLDDQTIIFQRPIPDPFVRQTVTVGWRDLLRVLFRFKPLAVTVIVGGDIERINDVLELDDQTLIKGRTREAAFRQHINERSKEMAESLNGGNERESNDAKRG